MKPALLAAATILALVGIETVLRITEQHSDENLLTRGEDFHARYFQPDPDIGVVRRPNLDIRFRFPERPSGSIHFQSDNLGLRRSTATSIRKPRGVRRILLLGDSHMDGAVDNHETAALLLERMLNGRYGRWEVLNAATGSYSPYQSWLWYEKFGRDLDPDIILFSIFLGNDFAEMLVDDRPHVAWSSEAGLVGRPASDRFLSEMRVSESDSSSGRLSSFLLQRSFLYVRLSLLLSRDSPPAVGEVAEAYRVCIGCTAQSLGQAYWFYWHPRLAESIGALGELLRDFRQQAGDRLVLLSIPTRLQIEPHRDLERIDRVRQVLGLPSREEILEETLAEALGRIGRDLQIPLIDPERALADAGQLGPVYHDTDWHLNSEGHRVVAGIIYERLRELGVLPAAPSPNPRENSSGR